MLTTLLCVMLVAVRDDVAQTSITTVSGGAVRRRGERITRIAPAGEVRDGDLLQTWEDGGVTVLAHGGVLISLGPNSALTFGDDGEAVRLNLLRGEARVVSAESPPLSLTAAGMTVIVEQAIARVAVSTHLVRAYAEAGRLKIRVPHGKWEPLAGQQELHWTGKGRTIKSGSAIGWSIQQTQTPMDSAAADSRWQKDGRGGQPSAMLASQIGQSGRAAAPPRASRRARGSTPGERSFARPEAGRSGGTRPNGLAAAVANFAVSGLNGGSSSAASGAVSSDAGNGVSRPGVEPSEEEHINLVTAQTSYTLSDVHLLPQDGFAAQQQYWSIGLGTPPTHQVKDNATSPLTPIFDTDPAPNTVPIPGYDAYLVQIYPGDHPKNGPPIVLDPAHGPLPAVSLDNLTGIPPQHPTITGASPLLDSSAQINDRMTFSLGEFAVQQTSDGQAALDVRRSDQDRSVVPNPKLPGNDLQKLNSAVTFSETTSKNGLTLYSPVSYGPAPTYGQLDSLQQAGAATLMAHELYGYAMRTGHTRFVIDGRILDITGYRGK